MCCLLLGLLSASGSLALPPGHELAAKHWFNNPVYRLHDDRQVVLFFFSTKQRESAVWAPKLNRLARRRRNVIVIGLTADSARDAERFIARYKVKFTVGAESSSAKTFGVDGLPALRLLESRESDQVLPFGEDRLDELAPDWRDFNDEDLVQLSEKRDLIAFIESGEAETGVRKSAVQRLWELHGNDDPQAIVELADSRVPVETDPFVRAALDFYRDTALGIPREDSGRIASSRYFLDFRDNKDAPEWAEVRRYWDMDRRRMGIPAELMAAFRAHRSDSPSDTVIRLFITQGLIVNGDRDGARAALVQILKEGEPDAGVRLRSVFGLYQIGEVGDLETADFLSTLADREPHRLLTRPAMEWVSGYLRTGEWDTRNWKAPP